MYMLLQVNFEVKKNNNKKTKTKTNKTNKQKKLKKIVGKQFCVNLRCSERRRKNWWIRSSFSTAFLMMCSICFETPGTHTDTNLQGDSPPVCFIIRLIRLPGERKINICAPKMSALPCSLFFPCAESHCSHPHLMKLWIFFWCDSWTTPVIWKVDFLAGCLSFGWRCCSLVRRSFVAFGKTWGEGCIYQSLFFK